MLSSPVILATVGTAKTAAKIAEGQDPTLTDAFLLAAGLASAPVPHIALGGALSTLDAQKAVLETETMVGMPSDAVIGDVLPIPLKPQMEWDISNALETRETVTPLPGSIADAAIYTKDQASIQPLSLAPDDPMINEVVDKMTPSPADQVAAGEGVVVLGSKVVGMRQYVEDGRHITSLTIEQQVADASGLRLENIMSLIAKQNQGEEISVSDVFVAVVKDLFEQPGEILQHIFHPGQVYAALRGTRTVQVDILSTAITRDDLQDLGERTDKVNFDRQTSGADVKINAELSLDTEQKVARTLNIHQVQYQWGEVEFTDYTPGASNADLASGTATEATVEEEIITTTDHSLQATGRISISGDSVYNTATAESHHQTVDIERRVYSVDGDVLNAAADGRLTDDELLSSNISVEQEESWREAELNYQEAAEASKTWATGNDPAAVAMARREIEPTLQRLLEQMAAGQPVDLAAGQEISDIVLAARQGAGPMANNPQSKMSAEYQEDGPIKTTTVSGPERTEEVDWGMDKKITTQTTDTVQNTYGSKITADQIAMDKSYRAEGIYDSPDELPAARRESQSFITVNEVTGEIRTSMDSTITSKTAFGLNTGKALGRDAENSATRIVSTETPTWKTYIVRNRDISQAIADDRLTQEEIKALDAELLHAETGETISTNSVDQSTARREFQEGWIDYAPLGSIASAGMKSSYGYDLTASDYFWAAADGVLTVGTLGAGSVLIKGGAKATAKGIAKNVMKGEWKKAGQQTIKAGGQFVSNASKQVAADIKAPFSAAKEGIGYAVKHGPVEAVKEAGRQVVGRSKMVINTITGNRFDLDKLVVRSDGRHGIRTGARNAINAKYADKDFHVPASKFKSERLIEKHPDGVDIKFKGNSPDFKPHAEKTVKINNLTGNHADDFAKANKAAGFSKTPPDYTWHHDPNGRDLHLVPTDLHEAVRHSGGASLLKEQSAIVGQLGRYTTGGINLGSKMAIKPGSGE